MIDELPCISWREFLVLVGGLGPNSATVTLRSKKNQPSSGQQAGEPVMIIDADKEPDKVDALFASFAKKN